MSEPQACGELFAMVRPWDRQRLRDFLRQPSERGWEAVRRLIVIPMPLTTLEMAVWQVNIHHIGAYPDPFTVYRALRHARDTYTAYLRALRGPA